MRIAITSDTHFGDPMCALVDHKKMTRGAKYDAFLEAVGCENDFLIFIGDIFDFSIAEYAVAYRAAQAFFRWIAEDGVAKSIIYIPGNHDFDMWHTVQHQINVIYQISKGKPARQFKWSQPGVIDLRMKAPKHGFHIPGVVENPVNPETEPRIPMYLNCITQNQDGSGDPTYFYFTYPNLYLVTDDESIILSHGHYLEAYWSIAGELIRNVAGSDLKIESNIELSDLVALNNPLCQIACSGIGQAGPLGSLSRVIHSEVKSGNFERVDRYVEGIITNLNNLTPVIWNDPISIIVKMCTDFLSKKVKDKALDLIKISESSRFSDSFFSSRGVGERLKLFLDASLIELSLLEELEIPIPQRLILGHTHNPISWSESDCIQLSNENYKKVLICNTGGWLYQQKQNGEKEFIGAEIFKFDGKFSSIKIK